MRHYDLYVNQTDQT